MEKDMELVYTDDLDVRYNYAILTNKTYQYMNKNYQLNARLLTEDDTISGMGYQLLDIMDIKLKTLIEKISKLKQNIDSKELTFSLIYESLEDSKIFCIEQGVIENIINRFNKTSYAFFESKTLREFLKYNDLKFYIARDNFKILINNSDSKTLDLFIDIYEKFKEKDYEYLDEFIFYIKERKNQMIKRK
jgi:hypothetical protein